MTVRLAGSFALGILFHVCTVATLGGQHGGSPAEQVGVYHWGGKQADGYAAGIRELVSLQSKVVRLAVSPRSGIDYNRGSGCTPNFTLERALDDPDLHYSLAHPQLRVIFITAYDGTGFRDCQTHHYLNPGWYTRENTEALVREYSEFVYRLHVLFRGTGKRFILSNWEGDNAIYCGQAYTYVISGDFRQQCLDVYSRVYAGNRSPSESVEGMILWFKARHAGSTAGRERAHSEGLRGVEVFLAPEFSSVRMLHDRGMNSVLYDVIPKVPFDFISYSSYESLSSEDPGVLLRADLDLIRSTAGTDRIVIGELGFSRRRFPLLQMAATRSVTRAALEWGVHYVIFWNLYDQDSENDFGLFDMDGKMTELGRGYEKLLRSTEETLD